MSEKLFHHLLGEDEDEESSKKISLKPDSPPARMELLIKVAYFKLVQFVL